MVYFEHKLELSPAARKAVAELRALQKQEDRIVVSPADAARMLSVSETCIREMLVRGEISSLLDGRLRRVIVASLFDHLVRKAIESYPLDGPVKKFAVAWQGRLGPKAQKRAAR
jgi:hypothetical protein